MRTDEEVKEAIHWLEQSKIESPKFTFFGENHHDGIDAMINVIENQPSDDEIHDQYGDEGYTVSEALSAKSWLDGECEFEDIL